MSYLNESSKTQKAYAFQIDSSRTPSWGEVTINAWRQFVTMVRSRIVELKVSGQLDNFKKLPVKCNYFNRLQISNYFRLCISSPGTRRCNISFRHYTMFTVTRFIWHFILLHFVHLWHINLNINPDLNSKVIQNT